MTPLDPLLFQKTLQTFPEDLGSSFLELQKHSGMPIFSPRNCLYKTRAFSIYHYFPEEQKSCQTPVLINYALINRPSILDLEPDRSFIKKLCGKGLSVYLIEWHDPEPDDLRRTLENYIFDYLHTAVTQIMTHQQIRSIHLMGVCQGGLFALLYAYFHPERIRSLIPLVTPWDFHTPKDTLSQIVHHVNVDAMVNTLGNIPGNWLVQNFIAMDPFQWMGQRWLDMISFRENSSKMAFFARMQHWINDCPHQPGETFRQFIKWFYQENQLVKKELRLLDTCVDLNQLKRPVFNIFATNDKLIPTEAAHALSRCMPSHLYQELSVPCGHVGLFISQEYSMEIAQSIADWCQKNELD